MRPACVEHRPAHTNFRGCIAGLAIEQRLDPSQIRAGVLRHDPGRQPAQRGEAVQVVGIFAERQAGLRDRLDLARPDQPARSPCSHPRCSIRGVSPAMTSVRQRPCAIRLNRPIPSPSPPRPRPCRRSRHPSAPARSRSPAPRSAGTAPCRPSSGSPAPSSPGKHRQSQRPGPLDQPQHRVRARATAFPVPGRRSCRPPTTRRPACRPGRRSPAGPARSRNSMMNVSIGVSSTMAR